MAEEWSKPPENSLAGLRHAMNHMDGVEFDLRLTKDDELIIFHDNHISKSQREDIGGRKWVEDHEAESLQALGAPLFSELIADNEFKTAWLEKGKIACIELKMPHPNAKHAGSVNPRKRERHARKMAKMVDSMVGELNPPHNSVVLYSFKRRFRHTCARAGVRWPVAQLQPAIPEIGNDTVKRILTLPSFMWLSLPFHLKHQQNVGAPMLPCALEYLEGFTRHLTLGRTVGLKGYTARRLTRLRQGYQAYVWPAPLEVEQSLRDLGLTGLSDYTSPELYTLPTGEARWTRWASQPLDEEQQNLFKVAEPEHHEALISEAAREVSPWRELSDLERRSFLANWRKKWQWDREIDELVEDSGANRMPWEISRLLGHRGSGKNSDSF
ncbi:MAG: glycerophosphodiester phosphodiesterase family protein [Candidatus Thalassarchaeaceae archaeon]|nr:glycerophosphodiester phosphodiesterase family protein [Candidatus Thalassarchaeaceae archaeon]